VPLATLTADELKTIKDDDDFSSLSSPRLDLDYDFGIPTAEVTEDDISAAHMNTADISIPKNVREAYASHGWELKWARYQKPDGSLDHENIAKYRVTLGGDFVPMDQLRKVDPIYARTLSQAMYKGAQMKAKDEQIIVRSDLALMMYKSQIANMRRAKNHAAANRALSAQEVKSRNDGLHVEKFSTQ